MVKIMFVCHGNICRSPMAEFIFKKMVAERGLSDEFLIRSAATSDEEIINGAGNPVYPPARAELEKHGISPDGKRAVQLQRSDYDKYDLFIGMDSANIRNMHIILGGDPEKKIRKMMDYTDRPGDVADPWFVGHFDTTYRDVFEACEGLLKTLITQQIRLQAYGGNSQAQYELAKYCEDTQKDIEQSIFWYRKAAQQGHCPAIEKCEELGIDLNPAKPTRKELQCRIYPHNYLINYKFTVICANFGGKWILSKHKKRDTWETQGGHIEAGEEPIECARRELFEESGIKDAEIYPVCDYWGFNSHDCSNGMVFLAVVHSLGELPESEMKEIGILDTLPEELTYPQVSPRLYEEAEKLLHTL